MELVRRLDQSAIDPNNEGVSYEHAGPKVVEWRRVHNEMSQIAFAELADVSVGCLQGLETGTRATRDVNLDKIAKAIGITRKELLSPEPSARPPADPRLKNLTAEDLQIARLFHEALTEVRVSVKAQLRAAVELARQDVANDGSLFPDVIDRRSGHDRRRPLAAEADGRQRALVDRMVQLAPLVIDRLETFLEAGADEWSVDFATRVIRQPPEIRTVLDNQLTHIEKRQHDDGVGSEKKSSGKKKP